MRSIASRRSKGARAAVLAVTALAVVGLGACGREDGGSE